MSYQLIKMSINLTWKVKNQLKKMLVQNPIISKHYINPKYKKRVLFY